MLKISRYIFRVMCMSFILVLPIGYYQGDPDSTNLVVGIYGGRGQTASVIRSCSGKAIEKTQNTFTDVSISAHTPIPPKRESPFVLGIRGGYFYSKAHLLSSQLPDYDVFPERIVKKIYFNPSLNFEKKYIGVGFGFIFGGMPYRFKSIPYDESIESYDKIAASGHIRIGPPDKFYVIMSVAENSPIVAGGGYFNIGFGFKSHKYLSMFTGISGGFYDRPGVIQQGRFRLSRNLDADITLRMGKAEDIFEGSISGGLVYNFGRK